MRTWLRSHWQEVAGVAILLALVVPAALGFEVIRDPTETRGYAYLLNDNPYPVSVVSCSDSKCRHTVGTMRKGLAPDEVMHFGVTDESIEEYVRIEADDHTSVCVTAVAKKATEQVPLHLSTATACPSQ